MLVQAYGAHAGDNPLESMQINRRTPISAQPNPSSC